MDFTTVTLRKEAGIATLTLNRPQRLNAINQTVHKEIMSVINGISLDDSIRVLVLTGKGRAFSAGGDYKGDKDSIRMAHEWPQPKEFIKMYQTVAQPVLIGLNTLKVPTIAMVNGPAHGMGPDLALACDMRIGSPNARFCAAWLRRAITTAGGTTWFLPRLIGTGKAAEDHFHG